MPRFPFQFFDSFVFRSPLFSYKEFQDNWSDKNTIDKNSEKYFSHPIFREAIYLASLSLYQEIEKSTYQNVNERTKSAFLKYYNRTSTRCTPFGLFSGVGTGKFEKETHFPGSSEIKKVRDTKLDMHFLVALSEQLLSIPYIKNNISFFPNNSIHKVGNKIRFVEYENKGGKRDYIISSAPFSEELELILQFSENGKTIDQLATPLVNEEISFEEAREFIDELIENQVLISELNPTVYGKDFQDGDYLSLSSRILEKNAGKGYNKYLDLFLHEKIIDKINYSTHEKNGHCNLFRLNEKWCDFEIIHTHPVKNTKIGKTLKARVFPSAKQKYHHLWKWYNDKKFTFDSTEARQELQNTEFSKSRLWMENTIFNLEQGYKWFVCHSKDKRLHTNLTNMNKELRKYLKYDGQSLQNIDINNSQIFFLLVLLHKIKNRKLTDIETESSIILELSSVSLCRKELQSFHDLVISGTFYTVLGKRLMKEKGNGDFYIKREYDSQSKRINNIRIDNPKDLMKPIAFEILFSKNNHYTPEKKWFREQFPTIYKVIEIIKSKNHNTLALLLQNLEAEAILDITATKIKEFNKNIPIYTIHDSILTIPEHTNEVKRIMIESIFEFTGLKPSVSVE